MLANELLPPKQLQGLVPLDWRNERLMPVLVRCDRGRHYLISTKQIDRLKVFKRWLVFMCLLVCCAGLRFWRLGQRLGQQRRARLVLRAHWRRKNRRYRDLAELELHWL